MKEKPIYNVWQNSCYVIKKTWKQEKSVILIIFAQIFLTVGIAVTGLFLPKTVVGQILAGVSVRTLIFTVAGFMLVTLFMESAKHYLNQTAQPKRAAMRMDGACKEILNKTLTADYANLEEERFTDAKQKALDQVGNNSCSPEQIYSCFADFGINFLGLVVYLLMMASVNPVVLIITAFTAILGVLARRYANHWQHAHDKESAQFGKRIWYASHVSSNYKMAKDIRLFAMTDWLREVYHTNLTLAYHLSKRVQARQFFADAMDCLGAFLQEGVAYTYLIWLVLFDGLPVDSFILLFGTIGGFSVWLRGILNEYGTLSKHSLNFCRLREFLEYPNRFRYEDGESVTYQEGEPYTLTLKDVTFRYSGATENILEHINLTIHPGEKLAIIGRNGAGKTTLVKLLCGFYDPTEGAVLLNGTDIRQFNRREYYTLFTAVFQEFNILPVTILENIAQLPKGEADRERVAHCLALADIDKKIAALPEGMDSLLLKSVNEEAVELSGGETQRLMLARALYRDAPILILDEPTAALDPISESRLYEQYGALSKGKTSLYISHRLASTRFCDRIILIEDKSIVEEGTHESLLAQGGKYAELFAIQSKYYQENKEAEEIA